jgi:hypothetical protein
MNMTGNLNVIGDLTVSGTVSNINSSNINIQDNIIILNSGINGSRDAGILINRYQIDNDTGSGDIVNDTEFLSFTLASQSGIAVNTVQLPNTASTTNDFYKNYWIKIISGFSSNQCRKIISYDGTTKQAVLSTSFTNQNPSSGDIIYLYYKSYVGLIYNEINDIFILGSSVSDPGNSPNVFTSYSSLTLNSIKLTSTVPSSNSSTGSIVSSGGFSIMNTQNSSSITSGGALTVSGGASIQKDAYIGQQLYVNNINITPSSYDILSPLIFNASNNTSTPQTITKLSFNNTVLGVGIYLHATLITDSNFYAYYHIKLINKSTTWEILSSYIGDDISIVFSVDSNGNVLYTSNNFVLFNSLIFKYKAIVI